MLRELCYDQDLYLLQILVALVVLPPDLVIVSILDRFGLLAYFSGDLLGTSYEGAQLGSMVKEVFYVLTTILSENGNAGGMSVPTAIRREIVHALAMGPCSFSCWNFTLFIICHYIITCFSSSYKQLTPQ
jgi:E3 ubiquitin-protein ligase UBR1